MAKDNLQDPTAGEPRAGSITGLLRDWSRGDEAAFDEVASLVHPELLRIARRQMHDERSSHTLECDGLVHEAFLQLVRQGRVEWQSRAHFYGVAAKLMRRILVDYARRRAALKRGGCATIVTGVELEEEVPTGEGGLDEVDILAVHEALGALEALDARQGRIVELRYFAGLSLEKTARTLDLSASTVKREWRSARAFLLRELKGPD